MNGRQYSVQSSLLKHRWYYVKYRNEHFPQTLVGLKTEEDEEEETCSLQTLSPLHVPGPPTLVQSQELERFGVRRPSSGVDLQIEINLSEFDDPHKFS